MGRKRQRKDEWMPTNVVRGRCAYELRVWENNKRKTIKLCPLDANKAEVWASLEKLNTITRYTFAQLVDEYLDSDVFKTKSPDTQKSYARYAIAIKKVFGKLLPNDITAPHIRTYMDKKGKTAKVMANHHKSFIGTVFAWGYERGKCKPSPTKGVKSFPEKAREKYIDDDEYMSVYDCAKLYVKICMEISYCCAARLSDVLKIKLSDLTDEGIYIKQGKTGKKQIKKWSPRLSAAVAMATDLPKFKKYANVDSTYLIHNMRCVKYSRDGFDTEWKKAKKGFDFTFHDIKAKSISDYDGDKAKFSGNKKTVHVYDRKIEVVDTLDFQSIDVQTIDKCPVK